MMKDIFLKYDRCGFTARHLVKSTRFIAIAALTFLQGWIIAIETPQPSVAIEAGVYLKGENAGKYREETRYSPSSVTDTIEQTYVFNRLGSRLELASKETYQQDSQGRLKGGHFETTASKSTVVTDFTLRDRTLQITTQSGTGKYVRNLPVNDELLGPEGVRRLLAASKPPQTLHYRTFVPSLGALADVTVRSIGREVLSPGPRSLAALKTEVLIQGAPSMGKLWTDETGHLVRMVQDSPLGPIEIARDNYQSAKASGSAEFSESYANTLAVSNIHLPHPRTIRAVTVELTKKSGAQSGWPDFSSDNQQMLEKTAERVVIAIRQPARDVTAAGASFADPSYEKPNALVQSDDPEVQRLARTITEGIDEPWQKALALQKWVATNMHFDTGIAMAPASELVRDRHGTCIGYSTLLAALARAANIPSRMKLGYVYDGGIWGGHAWTELLIHGAWIPFDSAEFFPGIADAARIGVITTSGDSGTIDHVADLNLLYGKVEIRVLAYTLGDREIRIDRQDKDYFVTGDVYFNRYLDLTVKKAKGMTFQSLDTHWPDRGVLTVGQGKDSATILYGRANPAVDLREQAAELVKGLPLVNWRTTTWNNMPAVRAAAGGKEAIVSQRADVLWGILTSGKDPAHLLEQIRRATTIGDFAQTRTVAVDHR